MALAPNQQQQQLMGKTQFGPTEEKFFLDEAVQSKKVRVFRVNTKHAITIRVFPEFRDGTMLRAITDWQVVGEGESAQKVPDVSNLVIENTATCQGAAPAVFFTGLTTPSDRSGLTKFDAPIGGVYIKLKAKQNKGTLPYDIQGPFTALSARDPKTFISKMSGPEETYFVSGAVLMATNEQGAFAPVTPMALNAVIVLRGTAAQAYVAAVARAVQRGIDPFDPDQGVCFTFGALQPDISVGRKTAMVTCCAGQVPWTGNPAPGQSQADLETAAKTVPVPRAVCEANWVDVRKVLKFHTYDNLMAAAASAYGEPLVREAMQEQFEQWRGRQGFADGHAHPAPAPVAAPATAPAVTPVAPAVVFTPPTPPLAQPVAQPVMQAAKPAGGPPDFSGAFGSLAGAPTTSPTAVVAQQAPVEATPVTAKVSSTAAGDLLAAYQEMVKAPGAPKA